MRPATTTRLREANFRGVVFSFYRVRSVAAYRGLVGVHGPLTFGRFVECTGSDNKGAFHVKADALCIAPDGERLSLFWRGT